MSIYTAEQVKAKVLEELESRKSTFIGDVEQIATYMYENNATSITFGSISKNELESQKFQDLFVYLKCLGFKVSAKEKIKSSIPMDASMNRKADYMITVEV